MITLSTTRGNRGGPVRGPYRLLLRLNVRASNYIPPRSLSSISRFIILRTTNTIPTIVHRPSMRCVRITRENRESSNTFVECAIDFQTRSDSKRIGSRDVLDVSDMVGRAFSRTRPLSRVGAFEPALIIFHYCEPPRPAIVPRPSKDHPPAPTTPGFRARSLAYGHCCRRLDRAAIRLVSIRLVPYDGRLDFAEQGGKR